METAAQDKSIQMTLFEYFADVEQFSLKDAKECVYQYAEKDVKETQHPGAYLRRD